MAKGSRGGRRGKGGGGGGNSLLPAVIPKAQNNSASKNSNKNVDLKTYLSNTNVKPISSEEAVKNVNPNYSKGWEYKQNCQRCVWAYELQRRGYDVEANPTYRGDLLPRSGNWKKLGNLTIDYKNGFDIYGSTYKSEVTAINNQMKSFGDGARGIVRVVWKGGSSGHVFNIENKGGKIFAYDAQPGKQIDLSDYMKNTSRGYTALFRTDNAKIDMSQVADYVKMKGE